MITIENISFTNDETRELLFALQIRLECLKSYELKTRLDQQREANAEIKRKITIVETIINTKL
jgi:hypothetical protein